MLAMQIPKGEQVFAPIGNQSDNDKKLKLTKIDASGLAFHKVADYKWATMPYPPQKANLKRYVGQPSTSATLSLAAVAAQCSRIWRDIDADFSNRCLTSAVDAWDAAEKNPEIYAYNNFNGSGPYGDFKLSDEIYWAASELFITTGEKRFLDIIQGSKHYLETPKGDEKSSNDLYWQYMASAGTISLALVDSTLPKDDVKQARANLVKTALNYQAQASGEGYNLTYLVKEYPWGSNSNVVIRSMFLILGYDFSNDVSLVKSAASNMDYILGTNPMNVSYITGYGEKAIVNPHHRFWAHQLDKKSPHAAPGALSGGPNSISFSDPVASSMKGNCIGQTCFRDDIGAWTLNEITINWNSPLVWVTSALNDSPLK
jgi:endoglucanase